MLTELSKSPRRYFIWHVKKYKASFSIKIIIILLYYKYIIAYNITVGESLIIHRPTVLNHAIDRYLFYWAVVISSYFNRVQTAKIKCFLKKSMSVKKFSCLLVKSMEGMYISWNVIPYSAILLQCKINTMLKIANRVLLVTRTTWYEFIDKNHSLFRHCFTHESLKPF